MSTEEIEALKVELARRLDRVEKEIADANARLKVLYEDLMEITNEIVQAQGKILADEIEDYLGD